MGYAKKALDLAIWADKVEEFVSHLKISLSVKDPLHVSHKGRQPNKYKSGGEPLRKVQRTVQSTERSNETEIQKVTKAFNDDVSTLQDSETKIRRCHKYKQVGHYALTCPNVNE
ncbi:15389_t:CDS:2 [Gigaspora rosea]|nr:15389_t:CDS:2 [Gigaspora rosea]